MRKQDVEERSWPAMSGRRRTRRHGQVHPKVTRWAQEEYESSNLPFFIKVIGITSSSPHREVNHGTNLRIPAAFAREYSEQMDNEVSLEDAVDGSIWKVSFRVPDEFSVWTHGWPAFALHYNLQPGHNLVLVLVAHSWFRFTLFNDHGSQIIPHSAYYSRRPQLGLYVPLDRKRKVEASNHHICIHMGISCALHHPKRRAVEPEAKATAQENSSAHESPPLFLPYKQREVTNVERRAAKNAASRYSRSLSNPISMTVLTPSHVSNNFDGMELPRRLLSGGAAVMSPLTLIDETGRSWEMQWTARGRHRLALLPEDWIPFVIQHFLEEGDACVFETLDLKAFTILVRIFRVVPILENACIDDVYKHSSVLQLEEKSREDLKTVYINTNIKPHGIQAGWLPSSTSLQISFPT